MGQAIGLLWVIHYARLVIVMVFPHVALGNITSVSYCALFWPAISINVDADCRPKKRTIADRSDVT